MKNTLKRLGALLIAAIMMIAMCVPVMARTTETALKSDYPTSADSAEVTVSGFEKGQVKEVWAYRIVDAEYDKNGQIGFSGYVAVKDLMREAEAAAQGLNTSSSDRIPIFGNVSVKDANGNEKYTYTTDENTTVEVYKKADGTYIDGTGATVTIPSEKTPTPVTEYIAVYPSSSQLSLLAEDQSILEQTDEGDDPGRIRLISTDEGQTFKGTVTVGEWMVIAVPADDSETIYNPMLVSVYYVAKDNGTEVVTVDPITANDLWDGKLEVKDAYTKSSRPTVLKEIVDNSRHNPAQDSGEHGDDHAIGDTVDFKITSKIPSYSDEFLEYVQAVNSAVQAGNSYTTLETPIKYEITDTMEKGLTYLPAADAENYKIKVYIGPMNDDGTPMEGTEEHTLGVPGDQGFIAKTSDNKEVLTYTYVKDSSNKVIGYKLAFNQNYILNNDNKTVTVTYSAMLNDDAATVNYDPNENTVDVTYTIGHEPTEDSQGGFVFKEKTLEDTTYHYTFEIDGDVLGSEEKTKDTDGDNVPDDYEHKTHELLKMDENGNTDVDKTEADKPDGSTETVTISHPLAGAVFSLTRVDAKAKADGEVYYAMSDTTGHFAASEEKYNNKDINGFKGLDAGVYELEEVKAPSGYSLNKTKYTIIIEAEYYSEDAAADSTNQYKKGMLKDYRIAVLNNSSLKDEDTAIINQIKAGEMKIADLDPSKVSLTQHTATYKLTKNDNDTPEDSDDTYETTTTVVDKDVTLSEVLQDSTLIKNTKLTDLPSTGGMGSYLFTIIGVAVMAIVAGSYFRSRAKKA